MKSSVKKIESEDNEIKTIFFRQTVLLEGETKEQTE
jgi:hypothetical protein